MSGVRTLFSIERRNFHNHKTYLPTSSSIPLLPLRDISPTVWGIVRLVEGLTVNAQNKMCVNGFFIDIAF